MFDVINVTFVRKQYNYGQRLQAYALQKFITSNFNCKYSILDDRCSSDFTEFECKYMNMLKCKSVLDFTQTANNSYYIVGSDQVFNFAFTDVRFHDQFLLPSVETDKKIAYSCSGADWILKQPAELKARYLKRLAAFKHVSIREQNDVDALFDEYKKEGFTSNVCQMCDPVLLLTKKDWEKIEKRPAFIHDGETFNFAYYIGDFKNIQIDNINTYTFYGNISPQKPLKDINYLDPAEWIWMIHHCNKFVTNSYHGLLFAIIFNKAIYNDGIYWSNRHKDVIRLLNIKLKDKYIQNHIDILKTIDILRGKSLTFFSNAFQNADRHNANAINYYAYAKDNSLRKMSTSGGVVAALASYVYENNGIVYGAAYSQDFRKVITAKTMNIYEYYRMLAGSKYSYCQPYKFSEIKKQLDENCLVLYIGCPCHIKALKRYLKTEYSNLLTVDVFCYGCSSTGVLANFVSTLEQLYHSKIISMNMRSEHKKHIKIIFENGISVTKDYWNIFLNQNIMPMCKQCNMHDMNNASDITAGDFWEYTPDIPKEFNPENGTNKIRINTSKGLVFFNNIKDRLKYI